MATNLVNAVNRVTYFSITNKSAVKSLVRHLIQSPEDSIILPFIDYPGPLSREILSRKFNSLTVCERDPSIREKFQLHCKLHYGDRRIHIYPDDLFDLSYKTYSDVAQKRCAEIVSESRQSNETSVSPTSNLCDRPVKFLVPLLKSRYEVGFLKNLYYQMSLKLGLCSNTLVHYYFLMSDRQYMYLSSKPRENMRLYRSSTVLYNTIFNIRTLESYDLQDCFGITIRKIQKTASTNIESYRRVHLTWLEPRMDVLSTLDARSLVEFRFLVIQLMQKRKCLVYSFLDKFFDNFRNDLTKLDIYPTTTTGDLDREQYYRLYLYLRNREDYRTSTFLQAVASADDTILSL